MAVVPDPAHLARISLFQNLTHPELTKLHGMLHIMTLAAGSGVMTVEQPGEVAYVILEGTVKIHIEQLDGTEVILAILGPGEILGEMSLVDALGRSASVATMEATTLLWLDRSTFWGCLREMPTMTYNLVGILSRRLRLANAHIQVLAALDVDGRIAHQLLAFAQTYGEPAVNDTVRIPLRLTQVDIAALVGASRVRVNQVLGTYRRLKYISVDAQHRITILDRAALIQLGQ